MCTACYSENFILVLEIDATIVTIAETWDAIGAIEKSEAVSIVKDAHLALTCRYLLCNSGI